MDRKPVSVEVWVVNGIIPEGHIGNRHVVEPVGELGVLESLRADVGVRVERLGNSGSERVDLDAGNSRVPMHRFRHQANEMTNAAGWFQNSSMLESEPLKGAIHGSHDSG